MPTTSTDDQLLGELIERSHSPDWAVRAAAGRQLAASEQAGRGGEVLLRLLLDAHDTAVTQATADALLERGDILGLRHVLLALARATSECTADELAAAFQGTPAWMTGEGLNRLLGQLRELSEDDDAGVRREALTLLAETAPAGG
ncbi:hypothetical protein [Streptomyces sp. NK15101]|uniref:hypothetical protein n=1 Tax=Streptomyces sp. NK15101 TaxID=2873261 RepID=UPI001CEC65A0|nr:hypothetical protein [Streptomyces sp. NK15101]